MGFFRVLFIFLLVYFITRLVRSLFQPKPDKRGQSYSNREQGRKEGDVTINTNNGTTEKKIKKEDGDYIDYEEV